MRLKKEQRANWTAQMRLGRAVLGLSQRAAAEKLGMSPWRFWRIEKNVSEATHAEMRRIRALLGRNNARQVKGIIR